jgi:hypothetical protein
MCRKLGVLAFFLGFIVLTIGHRAEAISGCTEGTTRTFLSGTCCSYGSVVDVYECREGLWAWTSSYCRAGFCSEF